MTHAEANTFLASIPTLATRDLEGKLMEITALNDQSGRGSLSVRSLLSDAIRKEIASRATQARKG